MAEQFSLNTFYARKLIHTPDNTSTFLRGDNTFTNEFEGQLLLTDNHEINLQGSSILTIGNSTVNVAFDGTSIQAIDTAAGGILALNPLGGEVQIGQDGLLIQGNVNINGDNAMRSLTITTEAGLLSIYGGTEGGNRGMTATTDGHTKTLFYIDTNEEVYFSGTLLGNASTASAWATSRNALVDLTSSIAAAINAGDTDLTIGVTGILPITSGGTGASNGIGAFTNLASALNAATTTDVVGDNTTLLTAEIANEVQTWISRPMSSVKDYILGNISLDALNGALVYKGTLNSDVPAFGYKQGWAYLVSTAGTYAGVTCQPNDWIISITDGPTSGTTVDPTHWAFVHSTADSIALSAITGATNIQAIEALNGSGFLVRNEGTWSFDTNTYALASDFNDFRDNLTTDFIPTNIFNREFQLIVSNASHEPIVIYPNTTNGKKFLSMTGANERGTMPSWESVTKADIGLDNVENIALSTWQGSSQITTLGTITTGRFPWSNINNKPNISIAGNPVSVDGGTLTAEDLRTSLGLSNALHFIGKATNDVGDEDWPDPGIAGYTYPDDAKPGDVIIDKTNFFEYVFLGGGRWERLGGNSSYKVLQAAVTSGPSVTNQWISHIEQDTNGNISLELGSLNTEGEWEGNAATATRWLAAQTVYVNLANPSTTTVLTGGNENPQILGVDGILGTAQGGTGVNEHTANRIVWSTTATSLQAAGNHFINDTKLNINSTAEPTENLRVNGKVRFVATNTGYANKEFLIGADNTNTISIGIDGIQAYNGNMSSTLALQPADGQLIVGAAENSILNAIYHGKHNFTDALGLKFGGMSTSNLAQEYYLWISPVTHANFEGIPFYSGSLLYQPVAHILTLDSGGIIQSSGGENLHIRSSAALQLSAINNIVFSSISGAAALNELGRFNSSGTFIIGTPETPENILDYKLYVDGDAQFKGNLIPETTETYTLGTEDLAWNGLYLGSETSYGSNTQPIWWNEGLPQALTYTANRIYYGASTTSFEASGHYISENSIAVNKTAAQTETFYVEGTAKITDVLALTADTESLTYQGGTLVVVGGTGISGNANIHGSVGIGANIDNIHQLYVSGISKFNGHVGIGVDAEGAGGNSLSVLGNTQLDGTALITGNTHITSTTNATDSAGALIVDGGTSIGLKLYVGGATTLNDTLNVAGASTLTGAVGIGAAPTAGKQLYVNGDTALNGDTAHNGNVYFANGTTYKIDNGGNAIFNNIDLTGNLTFAATGQIGTSKKILFSGSDDGAEIYYEASPAEKGTLIINMLDDDNARLSLQTEGIERLGIDSNGIYLNAQLQRAGQNVDWYQGRDAAMIKTTSYRGYDAILSMKTTAGDWSQGVEANNTMYWTYITDSNYDSDVNTITAQMSLDALGNLRLHQGSLYLNSPNSGIYYTGSVNTHQMIRFIDNTGDDSGNGISIGGGGLVVIGSGESNNTILTNVDAAGGSEKTYIASDNEIFFYPGQDSYRAGALLTMTPATLWAGVDGNTAHVATIGVRSGAGQLYMWSNNGTTGNRGLFAEAHGTADTGIAIIEVNTNNSITVRSNDTWGGKVRLTNNWIGFYADDINTTTRYGMIQTAENTMIFQKENGTSGTIPSFSFNGHVVPSSNGAGYLGLSGKRWAKLYVGAADSYGDAYTPVYWNAGVPTTTMLVQYSEWTINSGHKKATLTATNVFTEATYVLSIVVTSGEANLNAPITWSSGSHTITLNTSVATSGAVSGYILTARGGNSGATNASSAS